MEIAGAKEAAGRPLTADEEALKRNTDCVYFLASPLTCKKANECEYRHSEGARVNPRDCWYWLNSKCLNPKCAFRHPPLNGLISTSRVTSAPALPSHAVLKTPQVSAQHAPASHNPSKQSVPCIFFQKGKCLKGDRCTYMHGPQLIGPLPAGTPLPQQAAKVSASAPEPSSQAVKKESWGGLKECTLRNILETSIQKPVEAMPPSDKPISRAENISHNGLVLKRSPSPYVPRPPVPARSHQSQNGRDADEFLGESSPGFDVLVDDEIDGPDYLPDENDFGSDLVQGGVRSLYPVTDFDYLRPDYEPGGNLERGLFNGKDEYDNYGPVPMDYSREQWRASSERMIMDHRMMPEKRSMHRDESPGEIDRSDLRHQLSKKRRLDGPRPVVSPDRRGGPYRRDDRDQRLHRDQRHVPRENFISARLQGRIKLPVRSSPDKPVDRSSQMERVRLRGRISPGWPSGYQGRHHESTKRRPHDDDPPKDARSFRSQPLKRDEPDPLNFAGPKSLAELKGNRVLGSSQEFVEPRSSKSSLQESEDSLKMKRENGHEDGTISSPEEGALSNPTAYRMEEEEEGVIPVEGAICNHSTYAMEEEEKEGFIPEAGEASLSPAKPPAEEEGMIMENGEDREVEDPELRDEELDYEAAEGEDVYEDYEEELDDDDDDDDFARKVGALLS